MVNGCTYVAFSYTFAGAQIALQLPHTHPLTHWEAAAVMQGLDN